MVAIAMNPALTAHDINETQRSFELRKYFAPQQAENPLVASAFNESLNNDGALDAYAETVVWRLHGVHAMVSLIERGQQYFLAGAVRDPDPTEEDDECVSNTEHWFGCSSVSTPGGLCENTLALDVSEATYPCFIVPDLSKDERFKHLAVVDGTITSYRFYAGAPITTEHGINIGSLFIFDSKPRRDLTPGHRKFLHQQARNVMKHLETKREAAERRRAALMSDGIAKFLDRSSQYKDLRLRDDIESSKPGVDAIRSHDELESRDQDNESTATIREDAQAIATERVLDERVMAEEEFAKTTVLDKIRITLDHAAEIIKESLEIVAGGVAFLDAGAAHSDLEIIGALADSRLGLSSLVQQTQHEPLSPFVDGFLKPPNLSPEESSGRHLSQAVVRSSADKHKPPKILAVSQGEVDTWDPDARVLNSTTLASLVKTYPKGNVWSIDAEGFTSSLSLISEWENSGITSFSERRHSMSLAALNRERTETAILSQIFPGARQIIFLPLWDAGADRWYAGCFVWSQNPMPVFTLESELAYLSAFTNSMMVEISRLDAVTANKMKSDFIGSISHEFRSPLHGILASAEFLRDSILDHSQAELVATIQNCSGTLLDTINHVLDYSKINSFEISANKQGPVSNELYQVTNLALLCEDVVEGMVAANGFRGSSLGDSSIPGSGRANLIDVQQEAPLEVVIDFEKRDWDFRVEAGALRRIVMNLFGNAQKFTATGYIKVELRILEFEHEDPTKDPTTVLSLNVRDSGRGMSADFMERKLYHPFCQEDTFTPGVGLGLSIVWTIVNQLGGKIHVKSEPGKGTDIEVTMVVEKVNGSAYRHTRSGDLGNISVDAEPFISRLNSRVAGKSVSFSRKLKSLAPDSPRAASWACIQKYCQEWYGFEIKPSGGDILITDQSQPEFSEGQRVLMIHDDIQLSHPRHRSGSAAIFNPTGPFKLARCMLTLMDQDLSCGSSVTGMSGNKSDIATQTPLGSPQERTILDGLIMTDYGFSPDSPTTSILKEPASVMQQNPREHSDLGLEALDGRSDFHSGVNHSAPLTLRLPFRPLRDPSNSTTDSTQTMAAGFSTKLDGETVTDTKLLKTRNNPSKPTLSPLKILAVDDNIINLRLLERSLVKRKNDTTITAKDGIEAVEAVQASLSRGERIDVVFMDITMPGMDGFEATRRIRAIEVETEIVLGAAEGLGRETKVAAGGTVGGHLGDIAVPQQEKSGRKRAYIIALTGLASRRDRDQADACGCDDFLTKPVSFARIAEVLDRVAREKSGL